MLLLEAVNLALRSTGENGVQAINSSHPQIETILAEIDVTSKRLQRRGWWFNTARRVLEPLTTGPDAGRINVSAYDLVVPVRRSLNYYPKGQWLVDEQGNPVMNQAVDAHVRWVYPTTEADWNDMPDSFTDYAANEAALSYASNYDADELQLRKLSLSLAKAQTVANADNIRYARVNLHHSGSAGLALNRAWGHRYGVWR